MPYLEIKDNQFSHIDIDQMKDKGIELASRYAEAQPFPHIVIDDFISPDVLDKCLDEFPREADPQSVTFDRDQERFKTGFHPDYMSPQIRSLFYSLNSRPFLMFLENLTGINGLVADPYFLGGGFHEIKQGGHLSVHADFNHHKPLNLERRINVLIYLNKDWSDDFGGQIELWDKNMTGAVVSKTPEFNRCVIFNTDSDSYHGNPNPISHPENIARRSIALYYYTATWDNQRREHTTQFKTRPGSKDSIDWNVKVNEILADILPPILFRFYTRLKNKISRLLSRKTG